MLMCCSQDWVFQDRKYGFTKIGQTSPADWPWELVGVWTFMQVKRKEHLNFFKELDLNGFID